MLLDENAATGFATHVHRGVAAQPPADGAPPDEPLDQQGRDGLRHQLSELLTTGAVARCPSGVCPTPIVKAEGCNVLSCSDCGLFFCYLCSTALGFSHHGAHGSHFHDSGCWMFDGGSFTPALVQKLRTHGLLRAFLRTLHPDDREWLLRDGTARKALRDVQFVPPADAAAELQATMQRLRGNIDAAARIQQQGSGGGSMLADLVPPGSQARVSRVLALAEMSGDQRAEAEAIRRRDEIQRRRERAAQGGFGCCPPLCTICAFLAAGLCAHYLVQQIDRAVAQNASKWLTARAKAGASAARNALAGGGTAGSADSTTGKAGGYGTLTVHGQRMQDWFGWTVSAGLALGGAALTVFTLRAAGRAAGSLARNVATLVAGAKPSSGVAINTTGQAVRTVAASSASMAGAARPSILQAAAAAAAAAAGNAGGGAGGAGGALTRPLSAVLRAKPPFWSSGTPVRPPAAWPGR